MAPRPNTASAGCDPFADLLFSPRAAFIWDQTARAISWQNAAAHSTFGLGAEQLQAKLAARLTLCFGAANKQQKTRGAVKFKSGFDAPISCSFEVLELAGGHKGLIVSEALEAQEPRNTVPSPKPPKKKPAAKPSGKRPATPRPRQTPGKPAAPACQLTPEELQAFKAIGRTVRRLAQAQQRRADGAPETLSPPRAKPKSKCANLAAAHGLLFSAFDLVLFLNEDFIVTQMEGRPQAAGWRRSSLLGRPAAEIAQQPEQAILQRMIKKARAGAKLCRDALLLPGQAHGGVPFRAILGRYADGDARYFLALLSLELPSRLRRQTALPRITSLAA